MGRDIYRYGDILDRLLNSRELGVESEGDCEV